MNGYTSSQRVLVVYESMFGATRQIAEAIATGMGDAVAARVVAIGDLGETGVDDDIVIVGAPTHAHGLSRPESRTEAARWALHDRQHLHLEPASGGGIREWLKSQPTWIIRHAAFDTRADMPRIFTGSAAVAIDRRLTKLGSRAIDEPHSFLVDKSSQLLPNEADDARAWGASLAARLGTRV
ncbi:flavodoxin family protein [Microbacterium sp. TNHR37B]|uniref:flavodoxin family protein n=1 Tax=Microbacterium sp. TNHR37B TaxID=1775956 RepID=UPI0007B26BBA|nr:flavodoxin domain-containing protein [Microbacterium sp. TNHR37B]KZE91495.1 hypothetical protein AVP41_01037 [Microbacterium sp. TNHR37B]